MPGQYKAHYEVRQNLGCLLWITGFGGIGAIVSGVSAMPELTGWLQLMLGVDLVAVAVGIWLAKEWARWAAGIIATLYAVLQLIGVIIKFSKTGDPTRLLGLLMVGLMAILAWYCFKPSTRAEFTAARESIARGRSPSRGSRSGSY
jgi:hypothetical protein